MTRGWLVYGGKPLDYPIHATASEAQPGEFDWLVIVRSVGCDTLASGIVRGWCSLRSDRLSKQVIGRFG